MISDSWWWNRDCSNGSFVNLSSSWKERPIFCRGNPIIGFFLDSDDDDRSPNKDEVMTYVDDEVVPVLKKLRMGDGDGDYVRMANGNNNHEIVEFEGAEPLSPRKGRSCCWWFKIFLIFILVASVVVVFLIWAGPYILKKYIVPILDWEIATFNPVVLGVLLFTSLALFPCILVPSSPSMWVAGITFGYGFGFLLIISGLSIGMSLPYFIGSHFSRKIHTWIEKWPEKAAIVRLAGEGDWFHQFRAVILIRISPFPFIIFNYASVATNVKYCPYICGSLVGVVPEIFVSIYSGILVRNLADATQGHQLFTTPQIICNVVGFSAAVGATVAITIYAKRALKKLQNEEETQLI